jgi:thymidine phosphorylase
MDRFNLETAIMNAWNTTEDLGLLVDAVLDGELNNDELSNILIGLQELHNMRSKKVFDIFESMIESGQIISVI